ncbi:hypothetical protein DUK53_08760 [Listeria sp. SHR_NRA_18]|uniref:hypothetical protein n=1 Tax=Listeria TaxID=1637 RepID=UPI00051DF38F|nr:MULTISPECIES: hypothetical protein [Listeria]KGL46057.1 hypothetical protein EP56_02985 [Listeriaceae bacterium FSL A5-0209]KMT62580.1 phage protein XkdV [Listeria newyorkensis]RQW66718.1 hypothetical protein DUK53_08760 [Listeria sp. SHR_NRA_18]
MKIEIIDGQSNIKQQDTGTVIGLRLIESNGKALVWKGQDVTIIFGNKTGRLIDKYNSEIEKGTRDGELFFSIDANEVDLIGVGTIYIEVHIVEEGNLRIFPDSGYTRIKFNQNLNAVVGDVVNTVTLEYFEEVFAGLQSDVNKVKNEADTLVNNVNELINKQNGINEQVAASTALANANKVLIESNLALKKTGDTATGTLNNTAESAYTISYGYLRHYIGAQVAGTVVRMYIGYTGHWGSYVDIVVGETAIVSNGDFFMNPITPSTTYATGVAPLDVNRSKSVINGIEKTASNTTNLKSALEFGRSGEKAWIKGDPEINGTLSFDIGKINPAIFYDASNITDTQSWARGIGARSGDRLSEFGISGVGKTVNSMYMGFGASPWLKANGLFIDNRSKIMSLFGNDIETVLSSQAKIDAFKASFNSPTIPLTLKNGFTAQNGSVVGYVAIKLGNRYLVWLKGWVTAATGVVATMPTTFLPDEVYQTAFPGAQQSSVAANQSNLYVNPVNGNIEAVAIGSTTAAVSLASIIYLTKEVAA